MSGAFTGIVNAGLASDRADFAMDMARRDAEVARVRGQTQARYLRARIDGIEESENLEIEQVDLTYGQGQTELQRRFQRAFATQTSQFGATGVSVASKSSMAVLSDRIQLHREAFSDLKERRDVAAKQIRLNNQRQIADIENAARMAEFSGELNASNALAQGEASAFAAKQQAFQSLTSIVPSILGRIS